jgi:hypothetical protein
MQHAKEILRPIGCIPERFHLRRERQGADQRLCQATKGWFLAQQVLLLDDPVPKARRPRPARIPALAPRQPSSRPPQLEALIRRLREERQYDVKRTSMFLAAIIRCMCAPGDLPCPQGASRAARVSLRRYCPALGGGETSESPAHLRLTEGFRWLLLRLPFVYLSVLGVAPSQAAWSAESVSPAANVTRRLIRSFWRSCERYRRDSRGRPGC